jgi:predicted nucleic-acid-binding Zn-ribbon protein
MEARRRESCTQDKIASSGIEQEGMQRGKKPVSGAKECSNCGTALTDSGKISIETGILGRFTTYYTFTCQDCGRVEFYDYVTVNRKSQGLR